MLKQSKQKNIALYNYPLLKLLISSVCLLIAFSLARMAFTVKDWTDNSYFSDSSLLLKDIGMATAMIGIVGGLYVGIQVWLAVKYTKDKSTVLRYGAIALLVAVSTTFVIMGVHSSINEITSESYTILKR
jgi:Na+/melibiose symporter-like transporter